MSIPDVSFMEIRGDKMRKHWAMVPFLLTSACAANTAGQSDQATDLQRSRLCRIGVPSGGANVPSNYDAANTTIEMNNDGGWCWNRVWGMSNGTKYGPTVTLVKAAGHGEVKFTVFADRTRIAYKPQAGYAGGDDFRILDPAANIAFPYVVTVTQ